MSQSVDPKAFYGYLFETNKSPTKLLDSLLRGIADYIVESVGNNDDKTLSPAKLAAFYRAVGGNYDSLYENVPYPSISWIYASLGCQHTLQPTKDDYNPPTIPALTIRGFVRWQSVELLLDPEEHVPFIQTAVRNFTIKDLDTGEPFPIDLPKEAFPLRPDKEIENWHNQCAERLRQRAAKAEDSDGPPPPLPPRPKVQGAYIHVRRPIKSPQLSPRARPTSVPQGYFDAEIRKGRPIAFQHVTATMRPGARPVLNHLPDHRASRHTPALCDEQYDARISRARRRSFPENLTPSPESSPAENLRVSDGHGYARRHSRPRLVGRPMSSDGDESPNSPSVFGDEEGARPINPAAPGRGKRVTPVSIRASSHESYDDEVGSPHVIEAEIRYVPKISASGTPTSPSGQFPYLAEVDRRGQCLEIDLNGKLSAPFMMGKVVEPAGPRLSVGQERRRVPRRNSISAKGGVRWKDLAGLGGIFEGAGDGRKAGDDDDAAGGSDKRRSSGERRSSAERDRDLVSRARIRRREKEQEKDSSRDDAETSRIKRRTSSHDRHRYLIRRERERDRERERESDREGRSTRDRESERQRDRQRRNISPVRGVDGRTYPAGPPEVFR